MPSRRVIWSGVSASSFWNRSFCHHLNPWASAPVGAPASRNANTRQLNDLRSVFMGVKGGYDGVRGAVYGSGGRRLAIRLTGEEFEPADHLFDEVVRGRCARCQAHTNRACPG